MGPPMGQSVGCSMTQPPIDRGAVHEFTHGLRPGTCPYVDDDVLTLVHFPET